MSAKTKKKTKRSKGSPKGPGFKTVLNKVKGPKVETFLRVR